MNGIFLNERELIEDEIRGLDRTMKIMLAEKTDFDNFNHKLDQRSALSRRLADLETAVVSPS